MRLLTIVLLALAFVVGNVAIAQDETTPAETSQPAEKPVVEETDSLKEKAEKALNQIESKTEEIAKQVDKDPRAAQVKAGILDPIYVVAEKLSFPHFHWLAFALMSAGVVSYTLQLLIGKLVVLIRMGFSLKEILSDAVGLAISVVGLVLTTQAAAENSTFTQSSAAVISATVVGAIGGIILYFWGQAQEIQAAAGRTPPPPRGKK